MISLTVEEILKSTEGKLICGDNNYEIKKIVIDSREADESSMFVAILGESQNGHKYIKSAYDLGCRAFLISDESFLTEELEGSSVIKVENTEIGLGRIAKYYRGAFDIPVIGVTGSVGKTTTRDMIYSVVSNNFKTLKNEKNLNNQFGVPLTLFNLNIEHECAVIEMGMCGFGEIEYLVDIVRPKIGVLSNIGMSHIELLGSQEGIFKAKMEITTYFDEGSTLIVNGDDKFLSQVYKDYLDGDKEGYTVYSFGKNKNNTISLVKTEVLGEESTVFTVKIEGIEDQIKFKIPTVGEHNIYNAMSAILVGIAMGMNFDDIRSGLMNFTPTKDRQDIIKTDKYTIINDVYNASPDSMIASLKVLKLYDTRRVAIFGDCLEMGEFAEEGHRKVGLQATDKVDVIITTGEAAKFIGIEAKERGFDLSKVYHFDTKEELIDSLDGIVKDGDTILVKASRGMKFEDIVSHLEGGCKC